MTEADKSPLEEKLAKEEPPIAKDDTQVVDAADTYEADTEEVTAQLTVPSEEAKEQTRPVDDYEAVTLVSRDEHQDTLESVAAEARTLNLTEDQITGIFAGLTGSDEDINKARKRLKEIMSSNYPK